MRINKIELKNFKRFTDLTIQNIPATAKLVLLIGANGSGKSSVFDAFGIVSNAGQADPEYYRKNNALPLQVSIKDLQNEMFSLAIEEQTRVSHSKSLFHQDSLYGRTSFRHIPRLTHMRKNNGRSFNNDSDDPRFFIDKDYMFERDIEIISERILKEVFRNRATVSQIQRDYIDPINEAFENIFTNEGANKLVLLEIIPPLDEKIAQITFKKGKSEIHYNLLSAGEKEITNILFDLLVQKEKYTDSIYFLDELDLHLNTGLQYKFIEEITENWIPDNCQLWTASHSLGFIDYARKSETAEIIDLDNLDFDRAQVIEPEPKDNLDVYEIAIPKQVIASILSNKKLVVTENKNSKLFNLALGEKSYLFLPANNNREVFLTIKEDKDKTGLRDRDYLRDDEIAAIKEQFENLRVLNYYTFENYLYHPDNLAEVVNIDFEKEAYTEEITRQKNVNFNTIISKIAVARQSYVEFKEGIINDFNIDVFIEGLKSNDLEVFYPYYNMKDYFDRSILSKYNLQSKDLVTTGWFKSKIEAVLSN